MIFGSLLGLTPPRLAVPPQEPDLLRGVTEKDSNAGAFSELLEDLEHQAPPIAEREFASSHSDQGLHTQEVMATPIGSSTGRVLTSADHFSSEVTIGESAVPFVSRPVVAPVESGTVGSLALPPASFLTESRAFTLGSPHDLSGVQLEADAWGLARTINLHRAPIVSDQMPPLGPRNASGSLAAFPMQVGALSANGPNVSPTTLPRSAIHISRSLAFHKRDAADPASVPRSIAQMPAASSAFAQLAAGQSEYRVIIRGQRFNPGEKDQLIQDLQLTLSELGLPLHPVRLLMTEGGL